MMSMRLPCLLFACLLAGCAGGEGGKPGNPLAGLVGHTPTPSEAARDAFNVYDADLRRRSVNLLASSHFGHEAPYLRTYRLLAEDPDPTVRAAAYRAIGMHGEVEDIARLVEGLEDEAPFARWEAAKAMQRIHGREAIGPLVAAVTGDTDADVRMAAAVALGQYPTTSVFDALVGALNDPVFSVNHAARRSLSILTGEDHGYDAGAWITWAENRSGDLFGGAGTYTYQPYQEAPGFLERARFWRDREPPAPRRPRGLEDETAG